MHGIDGLPWSGMLSSPRHTTTGPGGGRADAAPRGAWPPPRMAETTRGAEKKLRADHWSWKVERGTERWSPNLDVVRNLARSRNSAAVGVRSFERTTMCAVIRSPLSSVETTIAVVSAAVTTLVSAAAAVDSAGSSIGLGAAALKGVLTISPNQPSIEPALAPKREPGG